MDDLRNLWDRVERWAIYFVLFSIFVLEMASTFIPALSNIVDARGTLALLALALLLIFRYLDERLGGGQRQNVSVSTPLVEGIISALGKENRHNEVLVFAHTGNIYYLAFKQSNVKVKHLRVLLRQMDSTDDFWLPKSDEDKASILSRLGSTVQDWQGLMTSGRVERLSIGYYPFEPIAHFAVVDNEKLVFGLYKLESAYPGVSSTGYDSFSTDSTSREGRILIGNYRQAFSDMWTEFVTDEG